MNHLLPDASISTVRSQSGFSRARARKATFSVLCSVLKLTRLLPSLTLTQEQRRGGNQIIESHVYMMMHIYLSVYVCMLFFSGLLEYVQRETSTTE